VLKLAEFKERVEKYVHNMRIVLEYIKPVVKGEEKYSKIIDLSERYVKDADYYLRVGDVETAALCVAYAEGLLDTLRIMGVIDFKWPSEDPKSKPKVLVGGTFDLLHPGHVYLLEEASKYGRVYVIVARDKNSERFKGKKPVNSEAQRLFMVKNLKQVYDATLGEDDVIAGVLKVKPDIIVLGPDQKFPEDKLREELASRGLKGIRILRVERRVNVYEHCSSSSMIEEIIKRYCR